MALLPTPARFALMLGEPAWQRAAFDAQCALVDGVVQLAWASSFEGADETTPDPVADEAAEAGSGLAFDAQCRLLHSLPGEQRVERWLWPQTDGGPADVLIARPEPPQVFGALPRETAGFAPSFAPTGPQASSFTPRALACDPDGHVYLLDTAAHQVWIHDIAQRRLLRGEPVPSDAVDISWHGGWLWVLSRSGALLKFAAARVPQPGGVSAANGASRLTFAEDGRLFVLHQAHRADASVQVLGRPGRWLAAPQNLAYPGGATPFAFASGIAAACCHLVVARRREELFTRVALDGLALAEPLAARRYDGMGIAATPDGRVAFFTARGPRHATAARLRYASSPGRVVGFRLDAGEPQTSWGRVLLDACIPAGCAVRVQAIVSDDEIDGPRLARTPPANQAPAVIADSEATPLPLLAWLPEDAGIAAIARSDGSEQPWLVEREPQFATHEALAPTTPGRYLWLVFTLQGHSRATPRLRGVRAELPAHDWLRRLPQLYSRHEAQRDFLQRFLAPFAGLEDDLLAQSDERHALLKPCSTPAAALPWLAGWIGLVLDERWSEAARRAMLREAPQLFRLRGTPWALRRMVEIVAGARVLIVEQYRLRGLWDSEAALGFGLRVGAPPSDEELTDSFSANAHRFAVLVQADLDADTEAAIRHLLDLHRPAHTLYTLCVLGQGTRMGRGLQIGMNTVMGRSSAFTPLHVGSGTLGRGQTLGSAPREPRLGSARIGA